MANLFSQWTTLPKCSEIKFGKRKQGRSRRRQRLYEIARDHKVSRSIRGYLITEERRVKHLRSRGINASVRNPKGIELAHDRGKEARKGYDYSHSKLQEKDLHKRQHRVERRMRRERKLAKQQAKQEVKQEVKRESK